MSDDPIEAGFVRRRRFLIVTSLALAAAGYLGLTIHEVSVLGNTADVGHPERVLLVGYLVWAWALWTYTQWFRDCGAWAKTHGKFVELRDNLLRQTLADVRPADAQLEAFRTTTMAAAVGSRDRLGPIQERLEFSTSPRVIRRGRDGRLESLCVMQASYPTFPEGTQSLGNPDYFLVPINRALEWRESVWALFALVNSTRYFSEYFAPFVFAVLPLIVARHTWRMLVGELIAR